jgi:hypothetical protein
MLLRTMIIGAGVLASAGLLGTVGAAPLAQVDDSLVVRITSPQPGEHLMGRVRITGYAADRRSTTGSGLNERDIAVYLNNTADPYNLLRYAAGQQDSPAAAHELGPLFGEVGFAAVWEACAFAPGPYELIVWVSSLATPGARNFAAVDVEVQACPPGQIFARNEFRTAGMAPGETGVVLVPLQQPGAQFRPLFSGVAADFAAAVDARCTHESVDCQYGLRVRNEQGPGNIGTNPGYELLVDLGAGTYQFDVINVEPGQRISLLPAQPATAIRPGTAPNRLGVLAQGDRFQLFVNGEPVGEARDDHIRWGTFLGVARTTARGQDTEVEFAHFAAASVGSLDAVAPVLGGK